jgi:hypothetical protein
MDPFSVAGSAVGVTSLGLQVCQALVRYYGKFRSFHDDIDAVVRRTESLMENLQALESLKTRMGDHEVSVRLQKTMDTVMMALNRLNGYAKRCGDAGVPDNQRARARLVTKRALWPFRQDTLLYLQDTLDRTQADLALALQILGLEVAYVHLEALEDVKSTLMTQNDVTEIERGNQSTDVDWVHSQSFRFSSQLSAIERKLDLLVRSFLKRLKSLSLKYIRSYPIGTLQISERQFILLQMRSDMSKHCFLCRTKVPKEIKDRFSRSGIGGACEDESVIATITHGRRFKSGLVSHAGSYCLFIQKRCRTIFQAAHILPTPITCIASKLSSL